MNFILNELCYVIYVNSNRTLERKLPVKQSICLFFLMHKKNPLKYCYLRTKGARFYTRTVHVSDAFSFRFRHPIALLVVIYQVPQNNPNSSFANMKYYLVKKKNNNDGAICFLFSRISSWSRTKTFREN